MNRITRIITAMAIAIASIIGFSATGALAHHPVISVTTQCRVAGQPWSATWTSVADDLNRGFTWNIVSPAGYSPAGAQSDKLPFTRTASYPEAQTSATETVTAHWSNNAQDVRTATVDRPALCPLNKVPVPAKPAQNDPCGPNNAAWTVPANSPQITWSLTNGVLTASTTAGNIFTDGTVSKNFGAAVDANVACVVVTTTIPATTTTLPPVTIPPTPTTVPPVTTAPPVTVPETTTTLPPETTTTAPAVVVSVGEPPVPTQPAPVVAPPAPAPVIDPVILQNTVLPETGTASTGIAVTAGIFLLLGVCILAARRRNVIGV